MNLFQFDIIQRKGDDNKCHAKAFWQNELVAEQSYECPTFNSMRLDMGGDHMWGPRGFQALDGRIRNFSYIKNK